MNPTMYEDSLIHTRTSCTSFYISKSSEDVFSSDSFFESLIRLLEWTIEYKGDRSYHIFLLTCFFRNLDHPEFNPLKCHVFTKCSEDDQASLFIRAFRERYESNLPEFSYQILSEQVEDIQKEMSRIQEVREGFENLRHTLRNCQNWIQTPIRELSILELDYRRIQRGAEQIITILREKYFIDQKWRKLAQRAFQRVMVELRMRTSEIMKILSKRSYNYFLLTWHLPEGEET